MVTGAAALIRAANPLSIGLAAVVVMAVVSIAVSYVFWLQERRS